MSDEITKKDEVEETPIDKTEVEEKENNEEVTKNEFDKKNSSGYIIKDVDTTRLYGLPPYGDYTSLVKLLLPVSAELNNIENAENLKTMLNKDNYLAFMNSINSNYKMFHSNYRNFQDKDLHTECSFGNSVIKPRVLTTKSKVPEKNTIIKMKNKITGGDRNQFPLYNSGFRIAIKNPGSSEIATLKRKLNKLDIDLIRTTAGTLPLSNKTYMQYREIMEFIETHLISTTVNLTNSNYRLRDLIVIEDMILLSNAIELAFFPLGKTTTIPCYFTGVVKDIDTKDIDNLEKYTTMECSTLETGVLNLEECVKVDFSLLDEFQIETLAHTTPDSVSVERVLEYQKRNRNRNKFNSFELDAENLNGDVINVKIDLASPAVGKFIPRADKWYLGIKQRMDTIMSIDNSADREDELDEAFAENLLGVYDALVSKITIDGESIDDPKAFPALLRDLGTLIGVYDTYFENIRKYLDNSTVCVIAVDTYICSGCMEKIKNGELTKPKDKYTILEPLHHFLELMRLK